MIKVERSPSSHLCICGGELVSSHCVEFLRELSVEVRSLQASVLACAVLTGTSEGLAGLRVLEEACCRCCGTELSCKIDSSGNPS